MLKDFSCLGVSWGVMYDWLSRSNTNFYQFMASYVWNSTEKLAGDLLFGLKLVKLSILPMLSIQFV